ncbi:MAG: toxin-antitoxin system YwqK family antitoxin [Saprospiraceae bacterium]|jgi:antitoxin component YwqK of YwqJK toxin-antitoxin module|nr:toxin-antitoxin system YwqK family antitoxin [Saprospiraceae bacterium]MDG2418456.1 toxin-antitoxin system YwqK family antitoxin [Saprospiraceae bacterium]
MQKTIFLILLNLLFFQAIAQHKKRINFYELDVIRGLYYQPNTIKPYSGSAFDKFPNGKKRMEMPIKDGKIHGVSKEWSDKGKKVLERNFAVGVPNGKEKQWYPGGGKQVELNYINGKVEGIATEWYKNGQKKSEGIFRNGKEQGEHKWYFDQGQVDQVVNYENGLAQGLVKMWYLSGNLKKSSNFKNGQKDGRSTEWFENGQKFFEGSFRKNKPDGKSYNWTKNGQLIKEENHKFGKLIYSKNYLSGTIFTGDGYLQVFNEKNDFFMLKISGVSVKARKTDEITYIVDGDLVQIFNQPSTLFFEDKNKANSEIEKLELFVGKESAYIQTSTKFDIKVKKVKKKNVFDKDFIHWSFASPSSQEAIQKPRTVQEEHYISFICGDRILSLYGVVTNNDKTEDVLKVLERIANTLKLKNERIDLNALAASIK